jgi:FHS family L-fucose permease-like MFS transporter
MKILSRTISDRNKMQAKPHSTNYLIPTIIIGILFFIFGFVTWLNGTLINFLKIACEINNNVVLFLITLSFYISYFVMAIPSSWLLKITGLKKGMALGLCVMAVGALIFIPAAMARTYPIFLIGLFVQGAGLSLLQTASNPYITILGPLESAAKRISIMGIFNKVAGVLSPIILSFLILKGADVIENKLTTITNISAKQKLLNELASRVIMPYLIMAIVLIILALWIRYSSLPEVEQAEEEEEKKDPSIQTKTSILQFPHLIIGAIALFFYVGTEVLAGDTIGQYGRMLGFNLATYQYFTSYTLIFMVLGYIIGISLIPKYLSQRSALQICTVVALVFSLGALFTTGIISVILIALLGLANSLMWPAIWPLALNRLGRFTKLGSALLVMSIAGGAIMPMVFGKLADSYPQHPQLAYTILIPSYLVILFFATSGYKMGLKKLDGIPN